MAPPPLDDVVVVPTSNAKKRKLGSGEPRKPKFMKKILEDDKATKTSSFKKRMPTLMTKSYQLETLCGVSVCVLCYGSDGKVETWPKDRAEAEAEARVLVYKEKRESNVVALLEGTKRGLLRKLAREVSACFSDLADRGRLDAELKRIEDKIRVLTSSSGDQRNVVYEDGEYFVDDDYYIWLDDLVGPNFAFDPSLLGRESAGIGFGDQRVVVATQGRGTDLGLVENGSSMEEDECPNGSELVKVETYGANFEDDDFLCLHDIMGPDFENDLFLGLDGFVNPVQECSNSQFIVDNSCMEEAGASCTFDDTLVVGPDPNCSNSVKVEYFGNSCMKNCCSFVDDLVGPNFTFDPSLYGGNPKKLGSALAEWKLEEPGGGFCFT